VWAGGFLGDVMIGLILRERALAQHALQELFESGELNGPAA
jgi:hypothetical protein